MHILPGDPVVIMYGDIMPPDLIEQIRHNLGLDRPMLEQFITYISELAKGNLGTSITSGQSVFQKVKDAWPTTIELAISGLLLSTLLSVPLGVIAAMKRDSPLDHIIRLFSLYIHSNPGFWLALLFQLFFGVWLGLLPISGRSPPGFQLNRITGLYMLDSLLTLNFKAFLQSVKFLILPCMTIAITEIPKMSRVTRAAMLNVLGEDYLVTAKAKGLPDNVIMVKHAFRNAILPIFTEVGGTFTWLLGGTVIIEKIFGLPGLGSLLIKSLLARDYSMIQGLVSIYAVVVVIMNTLIDVIYATADPRVKY